MYVCVHVYVMPWFVEMITKEQLDALKEYSGDYRVDKVKVKDIVKVAIKLIAE